MSLEKANFDNSDIGVLNMIPGQNLAHPEEKPLSSHRRMTSPLLYPALAISALTGFTAPAITDNASAAPVIPPLTGDVRDPDPYDTTGDCPAAVKFQKLALTGNRAGITATVFRLIVRCNDYVDFLHVGSRLIFTPKTSVNGPDVRHRIEAASINTWPDPSNTVPKGTLFAMSAATSPITKGMGTLLDRIETGTVRRKRTPLNPINFVLNLGVICSDTHKGFRKYEGSAYGSAKAVTTGTAGDIMWRSPKLQQYYDCVPAKRLPGITENEYRGVSTDFSYSTANGTKYVKLRSDGTQEVSPFQPSLSPIFENSSIQAPVSPTNK